MIYKCEDCKEELKSPYKGCKLVPIVLCSLCVLGRVIFQCPNCGSKGCRRNNFYLRGCWICNKNGCIKCIPYVLVANDIEFEFCKEHKNYPIEKLKLDAQRLLDEVKEIEA